MSSPDTTVVSDHLQRFIFDDTDIRGEIVGLDKTTQRIYENHHYPSSIRRLLGEFIAATSLLSRTLKFSGILTLQARGDGDLPLIMAEISHQKKIRAIAQYNEKIDLSGRSLSDLLGQGVLSIIIDPDNGERYQGIVALEGETLAEYLESYFQQSEQLPTKVWLSSDDNRASGLLLQRLPQQIASQEANDDTWETQAHLASTITDDELLNLPRETLLTRLFGELGVRAFEPEAIQFGCRCSKARSSTALKHLERQELEGILEEEGSITVDCHFCGHQYHYDRKDIDPLFAPATQH